MSCKIIAELASRYKIVRREPGKDGKMILSDHSRQDGNDEVNLSAINEMNKKTTRY